MGREQSLNEAYPLLLKQGNANMDSNAETSTSGCYDCGGNLKLYEMDMRKDTKVMRCQGCGLFHLYKRDFFGRWKILKVTKDPTHIQSPE